MIPFIYILKMTYYRDAKEISSLRETKDGWCEYKGVKQGRTL